MRVGFIGLGTMGMPMLQRLRAAQHPVSFYARRTEVIEAAQRLGAELAASVNDLAANVEVMIVCVYSDAQVRELALGHDGFARHLRRDATLIIHTTGSPRTVDDIAAVAAEQGAQVLDAPVSGGPHNIQAGAITLLVGGDEVALERCKPVLAAYANPILHMGVLGAGQRTKLINNLLFGANVALAAEAARLLRAFGMEPAQAFQAITQCSGNSAALSMAAQMGSTEALIAMAGDFVNKDVATASAVAAELGVDTGLLGDVAATVRNND